MYRGSIAAILKLRYKAERDTCYLTVLKEVNFLRLKRPVSSCPIFDISIFLLLHAKFVQSIYWCFCVRRGNWFNQQKWRLIELLCIWLWSLAGWHCYWRLRRYVTSFRFKKPLLLASSDCFNLALTSRRTLLLFPVKLYSVLKHNFDSEFKISISIIKQFTQITLRQNH